MPRGKRLLGNGPPPNPRAKTRYWELEVGLEGEGEKAGRERASGSLCAHRAILERLLEGGQVPRGTPDLRNEALVCGAHTALVEGQVHGLHLADLHLPWRQQLLHPTQHLAQESLRFPQDLEPEQVLRRGTEGASRGQGMWVLTS